MSALHVPGVAPETIFHLGPVVITNTLVNAWLATLVLLCFGLVVRRAVAVRPAKLQNFIEYFLDIILGFFDQVTGDRQKTLRFLPFVGSVFIFILLSNWLGLLPGTGSITIGHEPLLRPANTDLNLTVVMAIATVVASHLFGFLTIGFFAHLGKFFQFAKVFKSFRHPKDILPAVIEFGVGLLEIISEAAKVLSLSLRLFGNIFAGEVLISVIASIAGVVVPVPFMLLELLVGLIQAGVFAMLALVYFTIASSAPHSANEH